MKRGINCFIWSLGCNEFKSLDEVREVVESWARYYNDKRPNDA